MKNFKKRNVKAFHIAIFSLFTIIYCLSSIQMGNAEIALCDGTIIRWTFTDTDLNSYNYDIMVTDASSGIVGTTWIDQFETTGVNLENSYVPAAKLKSNYLNNTNINFISNVAKLAALKTEIETDISGSTVTQTGTSLNITATDYVGSIAYVNYNEIYILLNIYEQKTGETNHTWVQTSAQPGKTCVGIWGDRGSADSGDSSSDGSDNISASSSAGSAIGPEIFQNPSFFVFTAFLFVGLFAIKKRNENPNKKI